MSNFEIEYTSKVTFSQQQLLDILTIAVEGGITYWAIMRKVCRDEKLNVLSFQCADNEDDGEQLWLTVTVDTIISGIKTLLSMHELKYSIVGKELIKNDPDLDAADVDTIVQFGLFGKLVYC